MNEASHQDSTHQNNNPINSINKLELKEKEEEEEEEEEKMEKEVEVEEEEEGKCESKVS